MSALGGTHDRSIDARSCHGKTAYGSARSALAGVKRMKRTRKFKAVPGARLNAYRCQFCRFWHVGNGLSDRGWA